MLKTMNEMDRSEMRQQLSRRSLLSFASFLPTLVCSSKQTYAEESFKPDKNPFTLGVASGDPDQHGFVLWTRLAPEPLRPGGGMPPQAIDVSWEVAADQSMRKVVAAGSELASPALGHSIHVELDNLQSDRWYWYRFRCGDAESPIGRSRTMPHPSSMPPHLRFAVTSCQNYEQGLYTAYQQMARENLDLVIHLGDYIYEYAAGKNGKVRTHHGAEIQSLDDYRGRYAQYKSDPLLQRMHARCPWIVTWDDHEFDNNCANDVSEEQGMDPVDFLRRRVNAYQAYYEMMPLRLRQMPRGSDMRLYRSAAFGRLAEFQVLDTRQYRSDQPNDDRKSPINEAALEKSQTMLGRKQRGWLSKQLIRSTAKWNVLAQQVMMAMVNRSGDSADEQFSMDQWPGYSHERMELMRFLSDRRISNPVVLTGDIHSNWVNELRVDDRRVEAPSIATEFVATSLSSGGNGPQKPASLDAILAENPCVKFHNGERGYIRCDVTPDRWKADYMVVDDVLKPGGRTFERNSFVVESGSAKVHPA